MLVNRQSAQVFHWHLVILLEVHWPKCNLRTIKIAHKILQYPFYASWFFSSCTEKDSPSRTQQKTAFSETNLVMTDGFSCTVYFISNYLPSNPS